jgi:hypothetical protein
MSDQEYVEYASGAAGGLAKSVELFGKINDGLTAMMDATEGPNETDAFDASCNTCTHFLRERFDRKERLVSIWGFPGTCSKFDVRVVGWPRGLLCGHACYKNRRTGSAKTSGLMGIDVHKPF